MQSRLPMHHSPDAERGRGAVAVPVSDDEWPMPDAWRVAPGCTEGKKNQAWRSRDSGRTCFLFLISFGFFKCRCVVAELSDALDRRAGYAKMAATGNIIMTSDNLREKNVAPRDVASILGRCRQRIGAKIVAS